MKYFIAMLSTGPPFYHVKRNETLTLKVEPIEFDGPLVVGLVHDHPDVQQNEIVNKIASDEEVDCKNEFFFLLLFSHFMNRVNC